MQVAFLTSTHFAQLSDDDRLAADELHRRGHTVTPLVWTEADLAALDRFDTVVMRSPWDWYLHRPRFRAFLETLPHTRARVVNAPAQLLAFADKTYLSRLHARGIAVVPTELLLPAELSRLPELLAQRQWTRAVLKPAFTANAVGAHRFEAAAAPQVLASLATLPESEPWLLQPFVPSIAEGEFSFLFFGGVFSHAVRKRPRVDDWRVQHDYGGQSAPHPASPGEIDEITELLQQAAPGTVYARVDAVHWEGRLHLMELEVVEPELFFRHEPRAPGRFADALLAG